MYEARLYGKPCGHNHRTLRAAVTCCGKKDRKTLKPHPHMVCRVGGYPLKFSEPVVVALLGGHPANG